MIIEEQFFLNFRNLYHKIKQQSIVCVSAGYCWDNNGLFEGTNFTNLIINKYSNSSINEVAWIPENGQFAYIVPKV